MKKNIFLMNLSLLLFGITGFFYFLIGNGYVLMIMSIVPISFYIFDSIVQMDKDNYMWILFLVFMWISSLFSIYSSASYKFLLVASILVAAKLIFESVYGWHTAMSKIFYTFSFIHTLAVLLCLVIPDTIKGIVNSLYVGETLQTYEDLFEMQAYAGITGQTSFAAFFASIFLGYAVCGVLNEYKKNKNIFLILLGFVALFLTVKRSYIISNVLAILVVLFIHNKGNKKAIKNLFGYAAVFLVVFLILSKVPAVQNVLSKNQTLMNSNDISNGRLDLWKQTIDIWKENPVFGIGINTLPNYHGISTHNVYLQILAEGGIFGFLMLIIVFYTSFIRCCKIYGDISKDKELSKKEKTIFFVSIYMQVVFTVYCFTGNPLYGISFFLIDVFYIASIKSYAMKKIKRRCKDEIGNINLPQHP